MNVDQDTAAWIEGQKYPDAATALKAGREGWNLARNRNVIAKPADIKQLDQWDGWKELGFVDSPDDYKKTLKRPALIDGVILDEAVSGAMLDAIAAAGHKAKVLPSQMQAIHDGLFAYMGGEIQKLKANGAAAREKLTEALQKEWGGDYNVKTALARRAFAAFHPSPDDAAAMNRAMGDPVMVKMFANIGERIGEASLPGAPGTGGGMTPEAAGAERRRLEGDPTWFRIFNDPRHPQHGDYVAQRNKLIEIEAKGFPRR